MEHAFSCDVISKEVLWSRTESHASIGWIISKHQWQNRTISNTFSSCIVSIEIIWTEKHTYLQVTIKIRVFWTHLNTSIGRIICKVWIITCLNAWLGRLLGKPSVGARGKTCAVRSVCKEWVVTTGNTFSGLFVSEHQRRYSAIKSASESLIVFEVRGGTMLDTDFLKVICVVLWSEGAVRFALSVSGIGDKWDLACLDTHFCCVFCKIPCRTSFRAHVILGIGIVSCWAAALAIVPVDTNVIGLVFVSFLWRIRAFWEAGLRIFLFVQSWSDSTVQDT